MSTEYGYARISTPKQNIDRQVRNILSVHPNAYVIKEIFTGTKFQGRKELNKLLHRVKSGDTIIFDSVSRMTNFPISSKKMKHTHWQRFLLFSKIWKTI